MKAWMFRNRSALVTLTGIILFIGLLGLLVLGVLVAKWVLDQPDLAFYLTLLCILLGIAGTAIPMLMAVANDLIPKDPRKSKDSKEDDDVFVSSR